MEAIVNTFSCSRFIPTQCKGDCCGVIPIPATIFQENYARIQRPVDILFPTDDDHIIPITKDGNCVFLTPEYRCGIYVNRPDVCKNFGTTSRKCNRCPYMDKDGVTRSRDKRRKIKKEVDTFKNLKVIHPD